MSPNDPFRRLDGLEPPDGWDDVVARAAEPGGEVLAPATSGSRWTRRPVLLAAAAVLVVAVIAGVAVVTNGGGNGDQQHVKLGPIESDPPTAMWGRTWQVVRIQRDGKDQPIVPASVDRKGKDTDGPFPLRFHTEDTGIVGFNGCNGSGGEAHLDGDVLVPDGSWAQTEMACVSDVVKGLMDQEAWLQTFLLSKVHVAVSGSRLTLTKGHDLIEMDDVRGFDDPAGIWDHSWDATRFVVDDQEESIHRNGVSDVIRFTFARPTHSVPYGVVLSTGALELAGCNAISTGRDAVSVKTDHLVVGAFSATGMACAGDPPLAVSTFFSTGPTVELSGDRLVLRSGTSSIEATKVPDGSGGGDPTAPSTTVAGAVSTTTDGAATTTTASTGTTSPDTPVSSPTTTTAPGVGVILPEPSTTTSPTSPTDGFDGHTWRITGSQGTPKDEHAFVVHPTLYVVNRTVMVEECVGQLYRFHWSGSQLLVDDDSPDVGTCPSQPGADDFALVDSVLRSGPTVAVDGVHATVTTTTHFFVELTRQD